MNLNKLLSYDCKQNEGAYTPIMEGLEVCLV